MIGETPLIADEITVDLFIQARPEAVDNIILIFFTIMINKDIAALGAAVADTPCPWSETRPSV